MYIRKNTDEKLRDVQFTQFITNSDQLYMEWYLTQQQKRESYEVCNEKSLNGINCQTRNVKYAVWCHFH